VSAVVVAELTCQHAVAGASAESLVFPSGSGAGEFHDFFHFASVAIVTGRVHKRSGLVRHAEQSQAFVVSACFLLADFGQSLFFTQ